MPRAHAENHGVNESLMVYRLVRKEGPLRGVQVHDAPLSSLILFHKYGWVFVKKGKYFADVDT